MTPYLHYENAGAAADWLAKVFGFEERARYVDGDGVVRELEMEVGGTELWMAGHGPGHWESKGRRPDQLVLVWVDDVDSLYERVTAAGVEVAPPKDQTYDVRSFGPVADPEGYTWGFQRRLGTGYQQTEGGWTQVLPESRPTA